MSPDHRRRSIVLSGDKAGHGTRGRVRHEVLVGRFRRALNSPAI